MVCLDRPISLNLIPGDDSLQTGIFYWFGYPSLNRERINQIAAAGFNNVSLWWGDQYKDIDGPKELLPDLARAAGLFVENIHTDFERTNLLWVDKPGWQDVLNRYLKSVDACSDYQIPTMVLHLTSGDTPPAANDLGIERLKRIIERAEQKNVNVALENLRITEYLDYVYEQIDSDRLKFCYDSGHENCFTKKGDLLDKYGKQLIALHLHDNDGASDQHMLPLEGNCNWPLIAKKLRQNNYNGSISLEITNEFDEKHKNLSAEQYLSEAFKRAKKIEALYSCQ